ncbi:MAG: hypothetical protein AB199_04395 [Parcubacteria bacterium C7867-004]|nr:MAG: hypothetical protein AB199_04395 [Parcubacteria bacterium C7867-004]
MHDEHQKAVDRLRRDLVRMSIVFGASIIILAGTIAILTPQILISGPFGSASEAGIPPAEEAIVPPSQEMATTTDAVSTSTPPASL